MKVLLITYKVSFFTNTFNLDKAIQELSDNWWHYLDNVWLIETPILSPGDVRDRLKPYLSATDKLLVIEVEGEYAGLLPEEAWAWLQNKPWKLRPSWSSSSYL